MVKPSECRGGLKVEILKACRLFDGGETGKFWSMNVKRVLYVNHVKQ
jgi:hypothetical protein